MTDSDPLRNFLAEYDVRDAEERFRASADGDLAAIPLAEASSRALAWVLQNVPAATPNQESPAVADLQHNALWMMGVLGFRANRAALQLLRAGYEEQAVNAQRLLEELHSRARKVLEDHSGEYAKGWLRGRPAGSASKAVGQEFWEFLSGPVHANMKAILDWLAISQPDGSTKVVVRPERRPEATNPTLAYVASETRDLANLIAVAGGQSIPGLDALDAALHTALDHWISEDQQFSDLEAPDGKGEAQERP